MGEVGFETTLAFRGIPAAFRIAFDGGGIARLCDTHEIALRECLPYRWIYRLADLLLPMTPLLRIAADVDRIVGDEGICRGSQTILRRLSVDWREEISASDRDVVCHRPILFYGSHGSALTPPLLAAAKIHGW